LVPEPASRCHRDERQIQLDTDRSFVLYPLIGGELSCRLFTSIIP
jgi:hypothetical protein